MTGPYVTQTSMNQAALRPHVSEFRAGWPLVLGGLIGTGLGLPALMTNTIGVLAPHLAAEFKWSFGAIFGGIAIITIVFLLVGPLAGRLVDRSNPWRLVTASFLGLSLGYLSLALSTGSIVQYYASWVVICLTGLGTTPIIFTRLINIAFDRRRGLALGLMLAGPGLVTALLKPLAGWAIDFGGWRCAVVVVGLLPILVAAPVCRWALSRAAMARPFEADLQASRIAGLGGVTLREAMQMRAFWTMLVLFLPTSVAIAAIVPHLENILRGTGIGPSRIVQLTVAIGVAVAASRLVCGWLMDQIWAPLVGAVSLVAAGFGLLMLGSDPMSFEQALLAIFLIGFAAGAEYDLMSLLVSRYFGLRHYGLIYGVVYAVFAVGAGFGPGLLGHVYDLWGNYHTILIASAFVLFGSAPLLLTLGRYPREFAAGATAQKCKGSHAIA